MTIAFWCVFVAILLPYGATLFAKRNMPRSENRMPRVYKAQLEGVEQRAAFAEANQFESFPAFAVSVVIAHLAQVEQGLTDTLAIGYVAARIVYFGVYLADRSLLRTVVWALAFACVLGQFVAAAISGVG